MFRFKQFEVSDEHCAMKVGTDGVLLGAWADVDCDHHILDVGTGTGLIAMMVAQRNGSTRVTAVDVDDSAVAEARGNIERTAWSERIDVDCCDIRRYSSEQLYSHLISNPPYFVDALPSPDAMRTVARHASSLAYGELIDAAERLLEHGGRLSVVLPTECAALFRREAFARLWLSRLTDVVTREGEVPKRTLMEFRRVEQPLMPRCDTLVIHRRGGDYSAEYRTLTKDFYLGF